MQNKAIFSIFFIYVLFLTGCATPLPEWKGTIEEHPPLTIDDPQIEGNNLIWQWHTNKWHYRGNAEIVDAYETWDYDPAAIVFRFQTPPQLNLYVGKPHSLYLKVFQLSDLKVFKDIASTPAGIRELLTSKKEDIDTSIVASSDLTISPSSNEVITVDRFKETKFVAVVAGYYQLQTEDSVQIFEIPSVANRTEYSASTISNLNPFSEPGISEAARIKAWVDLGVTKISRVQMLAQ
ncbi:type VI secretion lipoprotein TssJ [Psychrosphaera sp. B3R10]|uniref:type VI secretion lipoprotein TssJ n=1 Tax=unclassified Psychrosphaera TaxID=2641570 RepID=UPI001C08AD39|nr:MULTISPECIES: type VI secretion lipoprotein TssJ [unclassified Psychrosphaera]MBU2880492.1 type VI secretion lipoprotein TssJ [Psychrosphaera sp. I2R16]MBU2987915.1 type VI secretion lipoprotein TssJ [Psychrosphaera sp. B3R10]MDO6721396.1 type VI secretion lipoprotein TssJ [Psychrosphaera sp. 1_MG-2023]